MSSLPILPDASSTAPPRTPSPPTWWTAGLRAELVRLYQDLDGEVGQLGVVCWQRGDCCDFEKASHILYASAIEIAYVQELHPHPFAPGSRLCPFWIEGACHLRERRPLGCRTYFCDRRFKDRLEALYEKYHARLKEIAARHGMPWVYMPFVEALRPQEK